VECDKYLLPEPSKNVPEEAATQEEEGFEEYLLQRQIEREENVVFHLDLGYIPETNTIASNGWYFKRGRNEDTDEPQAKRMRGESDEISRMEEGLLEQQEVANFAAMVAYMRQQVQLAQQMMEDELTPCDCCR
jgi:hypothetical protein